MKLLKMFVAGEDVMDSDIHYNNIKKIQNIIDSKVLSNSSTLEDLILANEHIGLLIDSLNFWVFQGNESRYNYDLYSFLSWVENLK